MIGEMLRPFRLDQVRTTLRALIDRFHRTPSFNAYLPLRVGSWNPRVSRTNNKAGGLVWGSPVSSRAALLLPLVTAAAPGNERQAKQITAKRIPPTSPFSFHASRSAPGRTGAVNSAPARSGGRRLS